MLDLVGQRRWIPQWREGPREVADIASYSPYPGCPVTHLFIAWNSTCVSTTTNLHVAHITPMLSHSGLQSLSLALSSTSEKIVVGGADWGVRKEGCCGQWFEAGVLQYYLDFRERKHYIRVGNEWRWGHPHEE